MSSDRKEAKRPLDTKSVREAIEAKNKQALLDSLEFTHLEQPLDDEQNTPLLFAAQTGSLSLVKLLIEMGASIHVLNANEFSAVELASRNEHPEICKYLSQCIVLDKELDKALDPNRENSYLIQATKASEKYVKEKRVLSLTPKAIGEDKARDGKESKATDACVGLKAEIYTVLVAYLGLPPEQLKSLPLTQKTVLQATLSDLLIVLESNETRDALIKGLQQFFRNREAVLENTSLDYGFLPRGHLFNHLAYKVAEILCKETGKEDIYDVLLAHSKCDGRPEHAPKWQDTLTLGDVLPENPGQFVRWGDEIHLWEQIIRVAKGKLIEHDRDLPRIWLKTDTKKTQPAYNPAGNKVIGTSKPGALPLRLLNVVKQKGPACRELVNYTIGRSKGSSDVWQRFNDLHKGLVAGSVRGKGSEYVADSSGNEAVAVFFEWWNHKLMLQERKKIGGLKAYYNSGYGVAGLNGTKTIDQLLAQMSDPKLSASQSALTCLDIISKHMLVILDENSAALKEKVVRMGDADLEALCADILKELGSPSSGYIIYDSPLGIDHAVLHKIPFTLQSLIFLKLATAIEMNNDTVIQEILLNYPEMIDAVISEGQTVREILHAKAASFLMRAILENQLQTFKQFLEWFPDSKDAPINTEGDTPLISAAFNGRIEMVRYLLKRNVNVFAKNLGGKAARQCTIGSDKAQIVAELKAAEQAALFELIENNQTTAVHYAITTYPDLVNTRLNGHALVTYAISKENWFAALYLLGKDIDLFSQLSGIGHDNVFSYLSENLKDEGKAESPVYADREMVRNQFSDTTKHALSLAVRKGNIDNLKQILTEFPEYLEAIIRPSNDTTLILAAYLGRSDMVDYLLDLDPPANIFAKNGKGKTARKLAKEEGHEKISEALKAAEQSALFELIDKDEAKAVKGIISTAPDLRNIRSGALTLFTYAISKESWSTVVALFSKKTDLFLPFPGTGHDNIFSYLSEKLKDEGKVESSTYKDQRVAVRSKFSDNAKYALEPVVGNGNIDNLKQILAEFPEYLKANVNDKNDTLLILAAYYGSSNIVDYLLSLDLHANVFAKGEKGKTARQWAKSNEHKKVAETLKSAEQAALFISIEKDDAKEIERMLSISPDLLNETFMGHKPLTHAVAMGCWTTVDLLLRKESDLFLPISIKGERNVFSFLVTALKSAGKKELPRYSDREAARYVFTRKIVICELVCQIKKGELDNVKQILADFSELIRNSDKSGVSLLMVAAGRGRTDIVRYLLSKKVDVFAKDKFHKTALHWAVRGEYSEDVEVHPETAAVLRAAEQEALFKLIDIDDAKAIEKVLSLSPNIVNLRSPENNHTALTYVISQRKWVTARLLFTLRTDLFLPASGPDQHNVFSYLSTSLKDESKASSLVYKDREAFRNRFSDYVSNVEHWAAVFRGDLEALKQILAIFPELLNARNSGEDTLLILAASLGKVEVVKYLLSLDVDVLAKNMFDNTAFDCAREKQHLEISAVLRTAEQEALFKLIDTDDAKAIEKVIALSPNIVNVRSAENNHTPLTYAISQRKWGITRLLLMPHTDLFLPTTQADQPSVFSYLLESLKDESKASSAVHKDREAVKKAFSDHVSNIALWGAVFRGDLESLKQILAVFPELLNARNSREDTPFILAASHGKVEVVKYLLSQNVDVLAKNKFNNTAFDWATEGNKHPETAAVLKDAQEERHILCHIDENEAKELKAHIDDEPDLLNRKLLNGYSLLSYAISKQNWAMVKVLFTKEIDLFLPISRPKPHQCLLTLCVESLKEESKNGAEGVRSDRKFARYLFYKHAKYTLFGIIQRGELDMLKLMLAVSKEFLEIQFSFFKDTPLGLATFEGHKAVVEYLLAEGADVFATNRQGRIPRQYSSVPDVISKVLKAAEPLALFKLIEKDEAKEIERVLTLSPDLVDAEFSGHIHLVWAIVQQKQAAAKILFTKTSDIFSSCSRLMESLKREDKAHSLDHADRELIKKFLFGEKVFLKVIQNGKLNNLKQVLSVFPECLNDQNSKEKATPLMLAACYGQEKIVDYLLKQGSDSSLIDSNGKTARQLALEKVPKNWFLTPPDSRARRCRRIAMKLAVAEMIHQSVSVHSTEAVSSGTYSSLQASPSNVNKVPAEVKGSPVSLQEPTKESDGAYSVTLFSSATTEPADKQAVDVKAGMAEINEQFKVLQAEINSKHKSESSEELSSVSSDLISFLSRIVPIIDETVDGNGGYSAYKDRLVEMKAAIESLLLPKLEGASVPGVG